MLPEFVIEQVRQAADIVDVVQDFATLKRRGANMIGCCPFHNEKTPSFYVSPSKGIYKCFGCGKGGDAINFIREIEGLSYIEAVRWLANKYHVELPEETTSPQLQERQQEKDSIFAVLNFAKKYFRDLLLDENGEGYAIGYTYFKERGIADPTQDTFELGYSMPQRDALRQAALKAGYTDAFLEKAGLITIKEDGSVYDRFRGRVMFPIYSANGKVLGFGARILVADKNAPKYLNSPETDVYHKSEVLYGLFQAKNHIRNAANAYLTEGYTDVIMMHQAGVKNVVASSGTSLTVEQITVLKRYTKQVTVLYDGDAAGMKASVRGIDLLLEQGLEVRALTFPDGDDPDSYLRKVGPTAFQDYLTAHVKDFIHFKIGLYSEDLKTDPYKKAELISEMVNTIMKIPDAIRRAVCFSTCAELLGVEESLLVQESNKRYLEQHRSEKARAQRQAEAQAAQSVEQLLDDTQEAIVQALSSIDHLLAAVQQYERDTVRMIILYGDRSWSNKEEDYLVADFYEEQLQDLEFLHPSYQKVYQFFQSEYAEGRIPAEKDFINHPDPDISSVAISLSADPYIKPESEHWASKYETLVLHDYDQLKKHTQVQIAHLKISKIMVIQQNLLQKMANAADEDGALEVMRLFRTYDAVRTQLARFLGRTVG